MATNVGLIRSFAMSRCDYLGSKLNGVLFNDPIAEKNWKIIIEILEYVKRPSPTVQIPKCHRGVNFRIVTVFSLSLACAVIGQYKWVMYSVKLFENMGKKTISIREIDRKSAIVRFHNVPALSFLMCFKGRYVQSFCICFFS